MLSGAKKGTAKKMQAGGLTSAVPAPQQPGMGVGTPSGGMGVAAPGTTYQPGRGPNLRIGY